MNRAGQNAARPTPRALALDVGGTWLKAGLVAADGRLLHRLSLPTKPQRPPQQIEQDLIALHDRLVACHARILDRDAPSLPPPPTGLALPGLLSPDRQAVARADHLPALNGYPLIAHLRRRWGPGLSVGADCLRAAVADHAFGAGRGISRLVVASFGTGVGAAVLIDGQPTCSTLLGQVEIDVPATAGAASNRAPLDTVACAAALDRAVRRAAGAELDFDAIHAAVEGGTPAQRAAVRHWAAALAAGLAAWHRRYRLQRAVIAGGVTAYGPALLECIRSACRQLHLEETFDVHFSPLGCDAALIGAGLAALGPAVAHTTAP